MKLKLLEIGCGFLLGVYLFVGVAATVRQLPHCIENSNQGLILVSTLDGKLSALNTSGVLSWQISTDPGSLLKSNIHNLQLTNNGEWIQIIPSLTGSLYKFNGKTIDAIPITAESLLKSSFVYANDIVIAGGKEVKTYGVGLHTGHILYTCSVNGCHNKTQNDGEIDDVIIIERNTLTVHAHEPRTGSERWNFSVGHHNVKIPHHDCANLITTKMDFNITAIPPEGLIQASKIEDKENKFIWEKKFESPIVDVWIWDGKDLQSVDTFESAAIVENDVKNNPLIYLAMHNKQLYIHESKEMLKKLQHSRYSEYEVIESKGVLTIPWKPVVASSSDVNTKDLDQSTAISVLYGSEYVNGNGFYLYDEEKKDEDAYSCPDNLTDAGTFENGMLFLWPLQWHWTIHLTIITAICVAYFLCNFEVKTQPDCIVQIDTKPVPSVSNATEPETSTFTSHYECSFETIGCLGKGGFGVVFEAKQKIDQCGYAIKRITLDKEEYTELVLREVRALANLDHKNIVRYFNSWFERPPLGFCYEHDKDLIESTYDETTPVKTHKNTHKRNNSTIIDMSEMESSGGIVFLDETKTDKKSGITNNKNHQISTPSQSISYKTKSHSNDTRETFVERTPIYLYIQMQLCQAESLKEWLLDNSDNRDKTFSLNIFKQIVEAVAYVHSKNLIHRDLKPSNIFFSMEGIIKVGDFGLVTTMDNISDNSVPFNESILQSHTKGVGTQLYMSPEQIEKKKYNYKVDIYSLGVILYELMVPFSTESERIRTLTDLRKGNYVEEFVNDHDYEFRVLQNMLAHNPDDRPTTAQIQTSLFS
nr:eukaryotic translation initiation factor 2-alpha kinase-like [Onthophagus taurus]